MFNESDETAELRERIRQLDDEDLKRVVTTDITEYRPESIDLAWQEIGRRGLRIEQSDGGGEPSAEPTNGDAADTGEEGRPNVRYEVFRGTLATWDALFSEAAEFATRIGPSRLIGIAHSEDNNDGVVTVWYWS